MHAMDIAAVLVAVPVELDGLVRVEVWDFDTFDNDDFLGCVEIRLRDLVTAKAASNADDDASTYRNVRERAAVDVHAGRSRRGEKARHHAYTHRDTQTREALTQLPLPLRI